MSDMTDAEVTSLADELMSGNRMILARAITLVESVKPSHRDAAERLLTEISSRTTPSKTRRIGISGAPGVGKSSFIEVFALQEAERGERVAVLAVDPSGVRTGGSILGDKARMPKLSVHPNVFVRPSPSRGVLGGVAAATRKVMTLCEAAGYTTTLIETVGVGQSEHTVRNLVDFFVMLVMTGAGDELQTIKKGILECGDVFIVTKADGVNLARAKTLKSKLIDTLAILSPATPGWTPPVVSTSALESMGFDTVWSIVGEFFERFRASGYLNTQRGRQRVALFEQECDLALLRWLENEKSLSVVRSEIAREVAEGSLSITGAISKIIQVLS